MFGLFRSGHQSNNFLQMFVHGQRRGFWFPRSHALEYPPVGLESRLCGARRAQRDSGLAGQPFDQRIVDRGENRVPGDPCQA
jgi:hypothetical protein